MTSQAAAACSDAGEAGERLLTALRHLRAFDGRPQSVSPEPRDVSFRPIANVPDVSFQVARFSVRLGRHRVLTFRRLAKCPSRPAHTIVLTQDRFFETWAQVIDLNFGNRKHHAAPTFGAGVELMYRLEGRGA